MSSLTDLSLTDWNKIFSLNQSLIKKYIYIFFIINCFYPSCFFFSFNCICEKMASTEPWLMENGSVKVLSKEIRHGRTAHNMSSSSLRKKSDLTLVSKIRFPCLRRCLANIQEVILGTKLSVLFPAIPLAIIGQCFGFAEVSASCLIT